MIFFLEDLQFTDGDTKDFLPRLKRALLAANEAYPIAMIVTSRPHEVFLGLDLVDVQINLTGLPRHALALLAENSLGGAAAPELVNVLFRRSEGNPYFAEQILLYLQDESLIEMSKDGWTIARKLRDALLPGDISAILVARLDQLALEVKESIQTASVLGREFEVQILSHMLSGEEKIQEHIAEAEKAAIWEPLDEGRYIFSHGLMRDAAYSMQMQARLRELHALAVDAVEHVYAENLRNHFAELAYHAERADLRQKAQKYYTLAGKTASDLYQNVQAIDYYTRALAFTPLNDLETQFDLLVERVELFNRRADRASQWNDLDALEKLAGQLGDRSRLAAMLMLRTVYFFMLGDYLDSIQAASQAEALSDEIAETDLAFLAQTTWVLALMRLGQLEESMLRAQNVLNRIRQVGNRKEEARVLNAMGQVALEQKKSSTSIGYLVETLRIAREIKDRGMEYRALNNLAMSEGALHGDYAIAQDYYRQAYAIAREIGDRNAEGITLANLGYIAGVQGDFSAAQQYHDQALSLAQEAGNRYQETYTSINLSAVAGLQNNASLALQYAQRACELAQEVGDRSGEAWALLYMGHAHLLLREPEAARDAYQRSVEIRAALDQSALSMEPLAGLVEVALHTDEVETALHNVERILAYVDAGGTLSGVDEPLRIYHACYLLLKRKQDPRARQVLETGKQLLETQVSKFKDEQVRKMYVENVPWRHALQKAAAG